ncbi:AAA family ATPase [Arthrobacter sp. MI7-26]|uniref:AAA family ATPase n=1 Tax=Arthrobacter sp. MI7-26 TaxID=2993653 RepID=UPI0022492802|nr:AAA family ATPase [Arthrobacter sp. MI7-26]MCX2746285.1 AAA family ATPase [Arthrobacter sp. MI7-26]
MIRYFLSRLQIEGFRGINNESDPLELKFKIDSVNSVFAVNASGKSSLFEALCYAVKGDIPKLSELQAGDRANEYYVNRFHSGGKSSIEIDFTTDESPANTVTILITRDAAGSRTVTSPTGHPDPKSLLSSLDEAFTLLDYGSFQKFTEDTPLKRGRSFAALLGLSEYSNYRQSLKSLSDTRALRSDLGIQGLEATTSTLTRAVPALLVRAQVAYQELLGTTIDDSADLALSATEIGDALAAIPMLKTFFDGVNLLDADFPAVAKALESEEGGLKKTRLQTINREIELLTLLDPDASIDADFEDLVTEVQTLESLLTSTQGEHYKHLLVAAEVLIQNDELEDATTCPVCGTSLDESIEVIVEGRLAQYSAVDEQVVVLTAKWAASTFAGLLDRLEQSALIGLEPRQRLTSRVQEAISKGAITETMMSGFFGHYQVLAQVGIDRKTLLVKEKADLEKDLPPSLVALTRQVDAGRRFRDAWVEHSRNGIDYKEAGHKLAKRQAWIEFMTKACETFADAETRMTSAKVAAIRTDYQSMFADIMNTQDIVPELKRASSREELHVELTKFHGLPDISARAVLSESYRNALAISVFLSAAKRHESAPRFIVLDDVTSSFDSGHQWFLMEHIRNHLQYGVASPDGLQIIILSHDGQLEKYFDKLGGTSGWHHQKLQGSPPVGAVVTQAQGTSRLYGNAKAFLSAGQVQQAEPLVRQYFEFKLTEIIRKLNISVPLDYAMKDQTRMVSGSIKAIQDAIDLRKKAALLVLEPAQEAAFSTHHVTGLISNWVSHYETSGAAGLSANVLLRVLEDINQLAECFRYDFTDPATSMVSRKWYRTLETK